MITVVLLNGSAGILIIWVYICIGSFPLRMDSVCDVDSTVSGLWPDSHIVMYLLFECLDEGSSEGRSSQENTRILFRIIVTVGIGDVVMKENR